MVYKPTMDWQERVIHTLIDAGTQGIKQYELWLGVNDWIPTAVMVNYLEFLVAEGKVDKYIVSSIDTPTGGGEATVWRATTKLINRDSGGH